MNPSDYTKWLERAFLHVEGSLLQKSAAHSPSTITEEFVRTALVDGLKSAKPHLSINVQSETDVPWNNNPDINDSRRTFGSGRPKQHDASIVINGNAVAVVEVKWTKKNESDKIIEDVWKLLLTHSNLSPESNATRTFLLVCGEKSAFQSTLQSLRQKTNLHFRWSPQGKATYWPKPFLICAGKLANTKSGLGSLKNVLCRRSKSSSPYNREPTNLWWNYRGRVIARSWKTIRGNSWKLALWEIDYKRAFCGKNMVDWAFLSGEFP